MARWLARHGADVRVADTRAEPPHAARLARELPRVALGTGAFSDATLRGADLIAISPGLDRREAPITRAIERGVPVAGDVELFARALPPEQKVIAITGSNGKTTVTALAGVTRARESVLRVRLSGPGGGLPGAAVVLDYQDAAGWWQLAELHTDGAGEVAYRFRPKGWKPLAFRVTFAGASSCPIDF